MESWCEKPDRNPIFYCTPQGIIVDIPSLSNKGVVAVMDC